MNRTRLDCFTIYDDIELVPYNTRLIITGFYLFMMCLNTSLNIASAYMNIKMKHYKIQSMRLVLYISVADIFYALLGYTAQIIHILIPEKLQCSHRRLLLFLPHLFINFTMYVTLFIGLDRFFHIIFLERYRTIITKFRFNIMLSVYVLISVVQVSIITFGPVLFGKAGGARYSSPISSIFIVGTLIIYVLSIIKLRTHNNTSRRMVKTRNLAKLASVFLTVLTLSYLPIIGFTVFINSIRQLLGPGITIVLYHGLFLVSITNSSVNAIAYMKLNGRARNQLWPIKFQSEKNEITAK